MEVESLLGVMMVNYTEVRAFTQQKSNIEFPGTPYMLVGSSPTLHTAVVVGQQELSAKSNRGTLYPCATTKPKPDRSHTTLKSAHSAAPPLPYIASQSPPESSFHT
jgi:hypothetical protein